MENEVKLDLPKTHPHFTKSFIILLLAMPLLYFQWYLGLPFLILSVLLFKAQTYLILDKVEKQIIICDSFLGRSLGKEIDFNNETNVFLVRSSVKQTMNSRGTTVDTKVVTFDLKVGNNLHKRTLYEFKEYKNARKAFDFLVNECQLQGKDIFQEIQSRREMKNRLKYKRRLK